MRLTAVVLEGRHVRLEPLAERHLPGLAAFAFDPDLWRYTVEHIACDADLRRWFAAARADAATGRVLPFATLEGAGGTVVGSTRFGNYEPAHARVEIGWTFVAPDWQRTAVNTEAKLLMLRHAFETLGCRRVELKTDALNARSRAAIERLGAREEGTLRRHTMTNSGRVRDTVYYSILDDEWPAVRERLARRLDQPVPRNGA